MTCDMCVCVYENKTPQGLQWPFKILHFLFCYLGFSGLDTVYSAAFFCFIYGKFSSTFLRRRYFNCLTQFKHYIAQ